MSGARVASPMESVTGTMAWLGCVPGKRRGGLEPVKHLPFFRIVYLAEMEAALSWDADASDVCAGTIAISTRELIT